MQLERRTHLAGAASRLARRLEDDQMLELVIVAGWYRLLSCVINAAQVELEPWAPRFPGAPRAA